MWKRVALIILFALTVAAMVWVRVWVGGEREAAKGQEALAKSDLPAAIHHFDRAIHWYSPGSKAVEVSIRGLLEAAGRYEAAQDREGALYAYRILRSALFSVRHVRQPFPEIIDKCDKEIASLMAFKIGEAGSENYEKEYSKRLAQLRKPVGPKTSFALLAELGFFGWVASAFLFIWLGLKPEKGINSRRAALFAVLFAAFYVLWLLGLAKA